MEAMKDVASARGDDNIDEEKVKSLIGMTSEEYLAQNKHVKKNVEILPTQLEEEEEGIENNETGSKSLTADEGPVKNIAEPSIAAGSEAQTDSEKKSPVKDELANDGQAAKATKKTSTLKKAGDKKSAEVGRDGLEHTFSGFSQGSSIEEEDHDVIGNEKEK